MEKQGLDRLRLGRFSLLLGFAGLAALSATFFVPAVWVLLGVFALTTLVYGLLGVRTRAGRIGLGAALLLLPGVAFVVDRFGVEAQRPARRPSLTATVYFSPKGGCTDAIVGAINAAKQSVKIQAYYLTSRKIAQAIVAAHQREVDVMVILDKGVANTEYSKATFLANNGILPSVDAAHAIAHNKVIIIDSTVVITGSMKFTASGEEKNAENVLILQDASLATTYSDNWQVHARHATPYKRSESE